MRWTTPSPNRSSPRFNASLVGVAAGGVFHPHYWMQLAAPLALLAALGIDLVGSRWAPVAWVLVGAAVLAPLAYSVPVYATRSPDRVSQLTSKDQRYVVADEVADAVDAITDPDDRVAVLWTNAAIHWNADRASPFRHMWFEPLENFPGCGSRGAEDDHRCRSAGSGRSRDAAGMD